MASVRKVSDGKYQVRWREAVYDESGLPTGNTRETSEVVQRDSDKEAARAAQRRKMDIENEIERGRSPASVRDSAERTLGQWAEDYFNGARSTVRPDTLAKYRDIYRVYLAPSLARKPVGSIRVADVKKLRADLSEPKPRRSFVTRGTRTTPGTGLTQPLSASASTVSLSASTVNKALGVLRRILNVAVENEAIPSNPAAIVGVKGTTLKRAGLHATPEQIMAVVGYIAADLNNPVYALAVELSGFAGLRASELQGLEIRDLDISELSSQPTIQVVRTRKYERGRWTEDVPKSKQSTRRIPLDAFVAADLRTYLAHYHQDAQNPSAAVFPARLTKQHAKALGRDTADPVDCLDYSRWINHSAVDRWCLNPALKALTENGTLPPALASLRWHDLRHTFASINLERGERITDVTRWIGHSRVSTTMDIYSDYVFGERNAKRAPMDRPVAVSTPQNAPVVPMAAKRAGGR